MNAASCFRDRGFLLQRQVVEDRELDALRAEADRLATQSGSVCVRGIARLSPVFAALADTIRTTMAIPVPERCVRSILFDKTPGGNWPVAWHQDLTIAVQEQIEIDGYGPWSRKDGVVHTQPPVALLEQIVTLRVHLDPTPETNGALLVAPGSHREGRLRSDALEMTSRETHCCACSPGDVLAMRPLLLHASLRSQQPARRRILHFEYAPPLILPRALSWCE